MEASMMKLHGILGLIICCLFLFFTGCNGSSESSSGTPNNDYILLNEDDNGTTVEVDIEKDLLIELQSNPSTGYRWEHSNPDGSFIYQSGEAIFIANEECADMDGCGGIEQLTFKSSSSGENAISLVHRRVNDEAADQFHVDVIVTE
jgi:predicted secreted protein